MRIAIIDHSYHETTKSTDFFYKILSEIGSVQHFHDKSWCNGENDWKLRFHESDYDLIVIWQVHEAFSALSRRHRNVVFVPMYDAMVTGTDFFWTEKFRSAKCLSFSRKLHEEFTRRNTASRYFKYFPDPAKYQMVSDFSVIRPFFWYRSNRINLDGILELCAGTEIHKFIIHDAPDPGQIPLETPTFPKNISNYEISKWYDNREHYYEALVRSNVFFAPRYMEGIGMSFLEAMASGLCVVAPNLPTMNEYIANGTNGILYSFERKFALDFVRIQEIGARARETVERGFKAWQQELPALVEFLVTPKSSLRTKISRSVRDLISRNVRVAEQPRPLVMAPGKVSVVTVCLNAGKGLKATIESVLGQDRANVEYVILDGGSTDRSVAIIKKYAKRLAYWQSERDDGVYHAMNAAINHCTGDWVFFMNAGDTFVGSDSLSRMFRCVPGDADVVYGHHFYVPLRNAAEYHPAADFETTWCRLQRGELWFDWLAGIPSHQATAVRRTLLANLRFDTTFCIAADHELLFRARRGGAKFFNCDELISVYVGGGMSAKNYVQCKQEWARIGRMYGDATAVDLFYALLEEAETSNQRKSAGPELSKIQAVLHRFQQALRDFALRTIPGARPPSDAR